MPPLQKRASNRKEIMFQFVKADPLCYIFSAYFIKLSQDLRHVFTRACVVSRCSYIVNEIKRLWGMPVAKVDSALLKWINIVAFALTVAVNGLAGSTTVLGGKLTAEISDANPTLITPAGYVFSIWGIIYVLLGIFVVFQALPSQRGRDYQERIGWLFVSSCLLNIAWLFLWQFEYLIISVAIMFLLLVTLIAVYLRLNIGRSTASLREKLAVHLPFSVYLGWITIASIANVAVTLVSTGWDGFGITQETWATLIIIIAVLITLLVIATRKDVAYGLVIIWSLIGIGVNQSGNQNIVTATEVGVVIIAIALASSILVSRFRR
jgi:benzodiazapine receptor